MLRKLIAGLLSLVLVFACCGCGETTAQQVIPEDIFAEELATDELVIYSWTNDKLKDVSWDSFLSTATAVFRRSNPNVELIHKVFPYDEYDDILTVELLAGKGPDLILWENLRTDVLPDPNKTIETGIFMDLDPLFAQDPEFSYDNFTPAFDAGVYKKGRYYVPLNYLLLSTAVNGARIQNSDFPWQPRQSYDEYTTSLLAYLESHSELERNSDTQDFSWWREQYLYSSGLQLIDYETETVLPDREGLEKLTEFCKEMQPYFTYYTPLEAYSAFAEEFPVSNYFLYEDKLFLTNLFFMNIRWAGVDFQGDFAPTTAIVPALAGEQAAAIPGISAAIRSGTSNLQNAYKMLQILLSRTAQYGLLQSVPIDDGQLYQEFGRELPTETNEALYDLTSNVVPYQQFSPKLWEIYVQYMTPYWEGNASYEDCVADLESMLELYMYE